MAGNIDMFGGDRSISGINLFSVSHNPLEQMDMGLASMVGWGKNLHMIPKGQEGALADFLDQIIEKLKEMFENIFAKIGDWVAEFEAKTGLNIDEGIVKFLQSLIALLKQHRLDWVSDFEDKTGLNIDEGLRAFLISLREKLKQERLDWINEFEDKTGLNIDEGLEAFWLSWVAVQKQRRLDWVTQFEDKTGLNIDEGIVKFLESWRDAQKQAQMDWISEFEAKSGLNIDQGAAAFFISLRNLLRPEWQRDGVDWVADFEAKTGLNVDEGAAAFLTSLLAKLRPEWQKDGVDWIPDFEAKTGLNVDEGVAKFLESLTAKMRPEWAKDTTPLGDRIRDLIDGIGNAKPGAGTTTNRPVADAIAAIVANIKDVADTRDGIAKALAGEDTSSVSGGLDTPGQEMLAALQRAASTLSEHSRLLQLLQAKQDTSVSKGALYNINFAGMPNGPLPADFKVTYSGPGNSTIGVSGGTAGWNIGNNVNRDASIIYQKPTLTDFQVIRGTMSTPPQQAGGTGDTPYFYALGRVSADGRSYVWARGYCTGLLQFKADLGCTVDGVDTVWQQGIALTWSLDMHLAVGVGTNARQYQVWSGNQLVTTYTEQMVGGAYKSLMGNTWKVVPVADSGTFTLTYKTKTTAAIAWNATGIQVAAALSALTAGETWTATGNATTAGGPWYLNPPADQVATEALTGNAANLRSGLSQGTLALTRDDQKLWGCIAQVRAGTGLAGARHSGRLAGSSVADNLAPAVLGTYARMSRGTSATVSWNGGNHVGLPNSFFTTAVESPDIDANTSDGTMTVSKTCPYTISARIECNTVVSVGALQATLGLEVMKGGKGSWIPIADGATVAVSSGQALVGNWVHYLEEGDKIRLCTSRSGSASNTLSGDSNGVLSYFSIAGLG